MLRGKVKIWICVKKNKKKTKLQVMFLHFFHSCKCYLIHRFDSNKEANRDWRGKKCSPIQAFADSVAITAIISILAHHYAVFFLSYSKCSSLITFHGAILLLFQGYFSSFISIADFRKVCQGIEHIERTSKLLLD